MSPFHLSCGLEGNRVTSTAYEKNKVESDRLVHNGLLYPFTWKNFTIMSDRRQMTKNPESKPLTRLFFHFEKLCKSGSSSENF